MTAIALLALCISPVAHAGVGTSVGVSPGGMSFGALGAPGGFLPSLDYRADPLVLQFHVLEFIGPLLETQDILLGANIYYEVGGGSVGGTWMGVVQPGGSIDILGDPFVIAAAAEVRVGAETASTMGLGFYVVPAFGVWAGQNDSGVLTGGALQVSAWFGGRGKGGGGAVKEPAEG